MGDDLLPCPFCGGEAERIDFGPGDAENAGGSCIACTRCQASGNVEFGRKENFIDRWNTRAAESALAQRAEGGEAVAWCQFEDGVPVAISFRKSKHTGCVTPLYTHPPRAASAVDWRELYRFQTAMRYMDNTAGLTRDRAYAMADDDIAALTAAGVGVV